MAGDGLIRRTDLLPVSWPAINRRAWPDIDRYETAVGYLRRENRCGGRFNSAFRERRGHQTEDSDAARTESTVISFEYTCLLLLTPVQDPGPITNREYPIRCAVPGDHHPISERGASITPAIAATDSTSPPPGNRLRAAGHIDAGTGHV